MSLLKGSNQLAEKPYEVSARRKCFNLCAAEFELMRIQTHGRHRSTRRSPPMKTISRMSSSASVNLRDRHILNGHFNIRSVAVNLGISLYSHEFQ